MSEAGIVKGYKVFYSDWTCRPNKVTKKQYACPGKFEEDVSPDCFRRGMHFCKRAVDCFKYYDFNPKNKVAEVIAYGDIKEDGDICSTNKLEIVREVPWAELLEIVNTGKGCAGVGNSGNRNSGDWNSGNWNSGNWNSGNCNSGDWNSGDWNSGDWNSGDWNKCSFSNGCFNTVSLKIYLFNKLSEWTYLDWLNSKAHSLLHQMPRNGLTYISLPDMTEEEKTEHPEAETTGGYLKKADNSESADTWWRGLSDRQKAVITAIPNFDKEIFKQITGIDVDGRMGNE